MIIVGSFKIGIGEYKVTYAPNSLITIALGSCVGIALYDRTTGVGGLAHIMLPDSALIRGDKKIIGKYADLAIPEMVKDMKKLGASNHIRAKIAGGASMFKRTSNSPTMQIGQRNIEAVRKELELLNIPLLAEHVGSNVGRTMKFDLELSSVSVRTATREYFEL